MCVLPGTELAFNGEICVYGASTPSPHKTAIFRQINQYLNTGRYDQPSEQDRHDMMRTYFSMLIENGEKDMVGKMKQFATYFTHGVRNGSKLRGEIYREHDAARILEMVDDFFHRELEEALAG